MTETMEQPQQCRMDRLMIWQQNINKFLITQHAVLAAMNDSIDIICL